MSGVQHITIHKDEAEQRLDRWVRKQWPHVNQGRIEKMCRKGELRVDGARAKASTRVGPGQTVRVPPIPDEAEASEPRPSAPAFPVEEARAMVLFRDDHLIVLNKPAGLAVQGGSKQTRHLGQALDALRFDRDDLPRMIHRIDRDTSGLLVLARTGAAATTLGKAFRSRSVRKIYFAAVAGRPEPEAGTIRYGLVKAGGVGHERMETLHPDQVASTPGAKTAMTDYQTIERAGTRMAWVAMHPVTGRTHQLRAHMAAIGCPIAGDGKYGGRGQENMGDGWGAGLGGAISRKLHLHAARLEFDHPHTGKPVRFDAPLPEHMVRTWTMMGWSAGELTDDLLLL